MKRRLLWGLGVIVAALCAMLVYSRVREMKKRERTERYEAERVKYAQALPPGLTRTQVEDYLRSHGVSFTQMCCMERRGAFAEMVRLGEGDGPWYCGWSTFIAFEFDEEGPRSRPLAPGARDTLREVHLQTMGDCP